MRGTRVELRLNEGEVHVHLEHADDGEWACPECVRCCALYDHQSVRPWRHLETCQYRPILHAAPPRSNWIEHCPRTVKLPWAEPGSRFTALFERLAIDCLRAASQKATANFVMTIYFHCGDLDFMPSVSRS